MKIALVTGGAKGLGLEWCLQLGRLGYKVVMAARDVKAAEAAAHELNEQELVVYPKQMDVMNEVELAEVAHWVESMFGRLDLLINNAGVSSHTLVKNDEALAAKGMNFADLNSVEVLPLFAINAVGPLLVAKHFAPLLAKSEAPLILNISSILGSIASQDEGGNYAYCMSKAALNMGVKLMAGDLKEAGVTVVAVHPGWVQTDMGGSEAPLTKELSIAGMIENVLLKVEFADSGRFLSFDGTALPW